MRTTDNTTGVHYVLRESRFHTCVLCVVSFFTGHLSVIFLFVYLHLWVVMNSRTVCDNISNQFCLVYINYDY